MKPIRKQRLRMKRGLFSENIWASFVRRKSDTPFELNTSSQWIQLNVSNRYWCADPFLIDYNGVTYVFCEVMDRKCSKGLLGIGVVRDNAKKIDIQIIKELSCHTSYPNVFFNNNHWFMIPETLGNHDVELYRATNFPFDWCKVADLATGLDAVDSTVFQQDNEYYVFLYEPSPKINTLSIARIDFTNYTLKNKKTVMKYTQKTGRPAGNVFKYNDKVFRPTQYGQNYYGEAIIIKEYSFDPVSFEYEESDRGKITCKHLNIPHITNPLGVHTYNSSNTYETIDILYNKIFLHHKNPLFYLQHL